MPRVMVTLRLAPEQASLAEVRDLLGLTPDEVDPAFGVVNISPAELRALLFKTAEDLGGTGFDHDFGWGVIDGTALTASLAGVKRSSRSRARR